MRYSYFPGCSINSTGKEYGLSINYVNAKIGMELIEIDDWNCCGATAGHSTSHQLGEALPARNIALAEQQGLGLDVVVPCAACYSRMKLVTHQARTSAAARAGLERLIEMPISGQAEILNLMDIYGEPEALSAIREKAVRQLNGAKLACYYGCLFVRPKKITGVPDEENPMSIDALVQAIGGEAVAWDFKTECCGASQQVALNREAAPLIYNILRNARAHGAQAIVAACPLCVMNLDMRQKDINKAYNENFDLPVYYISELIALALGAEGGEIGLAKHFQPAAAFVKENFVAKTAEGGEVND